MYAQWATYCLSVKSEILLSKPVPVFLSALETMQIQRKKRTVLCGLHIHAVIVRAILLALGLVQRSFNGEISFEWCARRYLVIYIVRRRFNRKVGKKPNTWRWHSQEQSQSPASNKEFKFAYISLLIIYYTCYKIFPMGKNIFFLHFDLLFIMIKW